MILADMASHVVETIGSPDAASLAQAKKFLKRRYEMIWNAHLWNDSKVSAQMTANAKEVIMPAWVDKVLQVAQRVDDHAVVLPPMDRQNIYQIDPELLYEKGDVIGFSRLQSVATACHPNGVKLKFISSEASDTKNVRLQGIHNGNEINETVPLNGTTSVTSAHYYDQLTTLSKPVTTGYIKVNRDNTAEDEVQILLAHESERRHQRIELHRDFTDCRTLYVLAKRQCIPLLEDNDSPQLEQSCPALIAFTISDMLHRMRQAGKAREFVQEGNAHIRSMMDMDKNQEANVVRFVPEA